MYTSILRPSTTSIYSVSGLYIYIRSIQNLQILGDRRGSRGPSGEDPLLGELEDRVGGSGLVC